MPLPSRELPLPGTNGVVLPRLPGAVKTDSVNSVSTTWHDTCHLLRTSTFLGSHPITLRPQRLAQRNELLGLENQTYMGKLLWASSNLLEWHKWKCLLTHGDLNNQFPHGGVDRASSWPSACPFLSSHHEGPCEHAWGHPAFVSKAPPHPYQQSPLCPLRPRVVCTGDIVHPWKTRTKEEACSGSGSGQVTVWAGSSGSQYLRPDLEGK